MAEHQRTVIEYQLPVLLLLLGRKPGPIRVPVDGNVYRHRVRLITDQMILRANELGIEKDGLNEMRDLYAFDRSERLGFEVARHDFRLNEQGRTETLAGFEAP